MSESLKPLYGRILTHRETEIFVRVMEGDTLVETAKRLGISRQTAENHMQHIKGKLGARTTAHAVAIAMRAIYRAQMTAGVSY